MYNYIFVGVLVLSILHVPVESRRGESEEDTGSLRENGMHRERRSYRMPLPYPSHGYFPSHGYYPSHGYRHHERSCDTETQIAMAEFKSEIQDLQEILIGLRQKLDPDFKLPSTESKCPPGFEYVKLSRSCYKVVYEGLNWTSAGQRCHDLHPEAHLVAITKNDENIALKSYLREELEKNTHRNVCRIHTWGDQEKMLWTSGQRLNETSCDTPFVWKISNDTQLPLSFAYWSPSEPNCHAKEEHCIHMRQSHGFKWNDISCERSLCPLCEFDPL